MNGENPPAETQQYRHGGHQPWCGPECTAMHYPPVPAETQQDDEQVTRGVARALWTQRLAHNPSVRERTAFLAGWDAALAARPSADTETLRNLLAQWSYERSPWFPALPWAGASENLRGAFLRSADRFLASSPVRAALDAR